MRYLFLCICIGASLIYSCEPTEQRTNSTEALQANFSVRYLATERLLRGQALWYTDDTSWQIRPALFPGGVSFMGSGMKAVELPGNTLRYETEMRVDYPNSASFGFRLMEDPQSHMVHLKMPGLQDFTFTGPLSLSQGGTLTLAEGPLKQGEVLTLLFTDANQQNRTVIIKGASSSRTIKLEALSLSNLSVGPQQVYLVRTYNEAEQIAGMSVNKSLEYYSRTQEVLVME